MKSKNNNQNDPRRSLPQVSVLLEEKEVKSLLKNHPRPLVMEAVNNALSAFRKTLKPDDPPPAMKDITVAIESEMAEIESERIRPVVNATGIILHTGLGRAALPPSAARILGKMDQCCNLQMDLETGKRGKRNFMTEQLLCRITGAEDAMVVNNNAGATLLILSALCSGKEVIISRGQLIEIGGSYRLPDCIFQSGASMVEVGTTNKTHLRDYKKAITENTGAVLRCNPSNYRIIGFNKSVSVKELVTLKKKHQVIIIDDLGCGALINLEKFGLPKEPTIQESIDAGADLVCSSGDKLIGGPQAGIILGKKKLIRKIRKHPLTRMLRVGKLTDAVLEHTLRLFLEPETLLEKNPTLRMITEPENQVKKKAQRLRRMITRKKIPLSVKMIPGESATGGGSLPHVPIPSWALAIKHEEINAEDFARLLRKNETPVVTRIKSESVMIDVRTLLPGEDRIVAEALEKVCRG